MASSLYNKISRIQQMKNSYITATNLRTGVNVFGVNGTYTADANASGNDMASGKTAYVNGTKISGSLAVYDATTRNIPWGSINDDSTNQCLRINYSNTTNLNTRPNYHINCGNAAIYNGAYMEIGYTNLADKIGLDPLTLKKDVTVLGVTGQYDASTEFSGIKMDPIIASDSAQSLTASITEVSGLDMTQGTNLAYYFNSLFGLTSLSNLSAPNVTNLYAFCNNDHRLQKVEYINLYSEEQSAVNCSYMFNNCVNIRNIPNSVIFPKAINCTWYMFDNCRSIESINTTLNIANINVAYLFRNCINLVTISDLNILKATNSYANYTYMFYNCGNLDIANVNLKGLNLNTNTRSMFYNTKYSTIENIKAFAANLESMKVNDYTLASTAIEYFDTNLWTEIPQLKHSNLYTAFSGCKNLQYVNMINDTASSMEGTFNSCTNLTTVNMDCPSITFSSMTNTFQYCTNLTDVNINLNSVLTILNNTFYEDINLVNVNLYNSLSQTSKISLPRTFFNCQNLVNVNFNTSMGISFLSQTFFNCQNLEHITFNCNNCNWFDGDIAYTSAFNNCYKLQDIDGTRDLVFTRTTGLDGGVFYNCSNLNINSIKYSAILSSSYYIGSATYFISKNPFITSIDMTIDGQVANQYSGTNWQYMIQGCNNLKTANINLIDRSTNNNMWVLGAFISSCANLTDLNLNIHTNSNRVIYSQPIQDCKTENLNYNVSRAEGKLTNTPLLLYNVTANNFNGMINGANANITIQYSNINNFNLDIANVQNLWGYGIYSSSLNTNNFIYTNIKNASGFTFENCTNLGNITLNVCNATSVGNPTIIFTKCNDLQSINANFSNYTNMYYIYINQCSNLKQINMNFANLQNTGYQLQIHTLVNCTDMNLHMPNLIRENYTMEIYTCPNLVNIDLGWSNSLTNIYSVSFDNLPNLRFVNMDYPNINNVYVQSRLTFNNCKNLSDETIDNVMGLLSKASSVGSKYINYIFRNCGKDQAYFQNLANYNNLISAGWIY